MYKLVLQTEWFLASGAPSENLFSYVTPFFNQPKHAKDQNQSYP